MHALLERQLRKCLMHGHTDGEVLECLKVMVDEAYRAADSDRKLLERSMEITSNELMQRNQELERALEEVHDADRLRRQFINSAAHELGTPLTPLKLQVRSMRSRSKEGEDRHAIEVLERNVDRLIFLVNDLLDSAKIQTQRMAVEPGIVDLAQVAAGAIDGVQEMANDAGVLLGLEAEGQVPVTADPRRLGQVLDNLLVNACKFTPAKGQVTVRIHEEGAFAVVEVIDTGRGIRAEDLHRLFQPFSQIHDTSDETRPGTGLGLYISKGVVDAMGGTFEAESPGLGQGSTFRFTLPKAV